MFRLRLALPITLLALSCVACRAKPEACEPLGEHVAELAAAEDKGGPGTKQAVQSACEERPPTRTYLSCAMAAGDLAALEGC